MRNISARSRAMTFSATLDDQRRQMLLLLSGRTEADGDLRYAPGKWSLKEVLGHINDTERIMSYRALRILARRRHSHRRLRAGRLRPQRPVRPVALSRLIEDYIAVRRATIVAVPQSGRSRLDSPRGSQQQRSDRACLAYIIAGHELHHPRNLEEKYLKYRFSIQVIG
jgi:hypothetical protein